MLVNYTNPHDRHKVFQVAHESCALKEKPKVGTVLSGKITWLPFVILFVKVFMHSSIVVHVLSPSLIGELDSGGSAVLYIALLWFMYFHQVWLDNLTLVALLTINSFPFPFPHKISGDLDILWYPIIISHFLFFSEREKWLKGNYLYY